ncbi:MAG: hypothetical protein J7598_25780 [Mitsuaria chitosanitabida]|uniref:hypothetical protein n=1 Tax=Roseateles chitosanitabidus TaxID=65048 RepID=UPI001B1DE10E|nr:hypothetical protein [Roseateles chitosanitabidus]MBO9690026.1 hypothetical protein [Roseateles chitosanitabidus]
MSVSTLVLAAAGAVAAPSSVTCDLVLSDNSEFRVDGHFDERGLSSNLSSLIGMEGVFALQPPETLVVLDGSTRHRWTLEGDGLKFDATLTEYSADFQGRPTTKAVLLLESRRFIGRHWGRGLVGAGLCEVRRGQTDETVQ